MAVSYTIGNINYSKEQFDRERNRYVSNILEIENVIVRQRDTINKYLLMRDKSNPSQRTMEPLNEELEKLQGLEDLLSYEKKIYLLGAAGYSREQAITQIKRQQQLDKLV
jgi:hypothetical protein